MTCLSSTTNTHCCHAHTTTYPRPHEHARPAKAKGPWLLPKRQGFPKGGFKGRTGVFQTGGFPDLDLSFLFCLFCPFWDFPDFLGIFPICLGMVRGFSRFALFLLLGPLTAPTRNSPERVRDTIWTFPKKSGKHPGLETPRFSFSQGFLQGGGGNLNCWAGASTGCNSSFCVKSPEKSLSLYRIE